MPLLSAERDSATGPCVARGRRGCILCEIFGTKRFDNQARRPGWEHPLRLSLPVAVGLSRIARQSRALVPRCFHSEPGYLYQAQYFPPAVHLEERNDVETAAELAHPFGALF